VPKLILASTSTYREALLQRLRIPFNVIAPSTAEALQDGEPPGAMAARLAAAKARDAAQITDEPDAIFIGSDQVLAADSRKLGKPGTHDRAITQLRSVSGRWVRFHTGLTVLRPKVNYSQTVVETYDIRFRTLSDPLIEQYLRAEMPYDCAGSLKAEALGIVLLHSARGEDHTALLGLPLISLVRLLREAGLDIDAAIGSEPPR